MSYTAKIILAVTIVFGSASAVLAASYDSGRHAPYSDGERNWMDHASQSVDGGGY